MMEGATSTGPGSTPITQTTFLTCRAQYPGGPNRCVSVSSLSARPSPVNRRVGIHDFTFEACSSFTHVTACKIACPPKSGLLSRGSALASYPAKPLGSYHVSPTTTWVDPPSTGDLRRWGALLTGRFRVRVLFAEPNEPQCEHLCLLVNCGAADMFAKWPILAERASLRRVSTLG